MGLALIRNNIMRLIRSIKMPEGSILLKKYPKAADCFKNSLVIPVLKSVWFPTKIIAPIISARTTGFTPYRILARTG